MRERQRECAPGVARGERVDDGNMLAQRAVELVSRRVSGHGERALRDQVAQDGGENSASGGLGQPEVEQRA
jgi:hypothetical protein